MYTYLNTHIMQSKTVRWFSFQLHPATLKNPQKEKSCDKAKMKHTPQDYVYI